MKTELKYTPVSPLHMAMMETEQQNGQTDHNTAWWRTLVHAVLWTSNAKQPRKSSVPIDLWAAEHQK